MKTIAFVGNPNTGKSRWINKLANSRLSVGNWNVVTVEKNEAFITWNREKLHLIDLPGITGFHKQSDEEKITEDYLYNQSIDCIVMVLDGCHMKSSLRLCLDVRLLQIPLVCLINFKDEAINNGIHIDSQMIAKRLSIPVVYGSSTNDDNKEELLNHIVEQSVKQVQYRPLLNPEADKVFEQYASSHSLKESIALFEKNHYDLAANEKEAAVQSCMKFCRGDLHKAVQTTLAIDKIILNKGKTVFLAGIFSFFFVLLYCGLTLSEFIVHLFEQFSALGLIWLNQQIPEILVLFLKDVVFSGIGTLLGFVPLLFLLYFYQAVLQESGLMARCWLLMDHWMRMFHLTGKSFLCFLLAHGCNVPAVVHSTSLENESIRKKTALLLPFCLCSARFAVLISFVQLIFKKNTVLFLLIGYGTGILILLVLSLVMSFKKEYHCPRQQMIQLPVYRQIQWKLLLKKSFEQCKDYIQKIFRLLFTVLSVLWLMMQIQWNECSLYEFVIRKISLLFLPLGFGHYWIYTASLVPGFFAKEASIGSLMMIQSASNIGLSTDAAINLSYLVYLLTTVPCIMTLQAQKQRYGTFFALKSAALSFVASYVVTLMLYQFIILF